MGSPGTTTRCGARSTATGAGACGLRRLWRGVVPAALAGTSSNLRIHVVDWYPTFCNLAGVVAADGSAVAPLPVDPGNPGKDIYGNHSWPDIDGVDVAPFLLDAAATARHGHSDFAAHPTLWVSGQVLLVNGTKLLVGQGFVGDSGEKTRDKDGWRYPNGSWVTAADVGWKCGLTYRPGDPYTPCLFDESDLREMTDLAPANRGTVTAMWRQLNTTNLGSFTARSPPSLVGPCNASCAARYWKAHGGCCGGPICGVPGCPA